MKLSGLENIFSGQHPLRQGTHAQLAGDSQGLVQEVITQNTVVVLAGIEISRD